MVILLGSAGKRVPPRKVEIKLKQSRCRRCWRRSGTYIDQLLLLPLGHGGQAVVLAGQVTPQAGQRSDHDVLDLPALGAGAGGRQAEPADAAPGAHPGREHVALVELPVGDLRGKQAQCAPGTALRRTQTPNPNPAQRGAAFCPALAASPPVTNTQDTQELFESFGHQELVLGETPFPGCMNTLG